MTDKDVLLEKYLLEKIATMKRFEYSEYSSLGKELKAQNDIEQKQYQNLDDTFRFDKIIKKEEPAWKRYNSKYNFYKYWRNNYSTRKKRWNIKQIEKTIIKMEHHKISRLWNDSSVSKFLTIKWVEVSDLSSSQYSVNKNIRFKTSMLRLNLCDYSNAYIVVKGTIDLLTAAANENDKVQKNIAF